MSDYVDPTILLQYYLQMMNQTPGDKYDSPIELASKQRNVMQDDLSVMQDPLMILASGLYDPMQFVPQQPTLDYSDQPTTPTLTQYLNSGDEEGKRIAQAIQAGYTPQQIIGNLQASGINGVPYNPADPQSQALFDSYTSAAMKMAEEQAALQSWTPTAVPAEPTPMQTAAAELGLPNPLEQYTAENAPTPEAAAARARLAGLQAEMARLQSGAQQYIANDQASTGDAYTRSLAARQRALANGEVNESRGAFETDAQLEAKRREEEARIQARREGRPMGDGESLFGQWGNALFGGRDMTGVAKAIIRQRDGLAQADAMTSRPTSGNTQVGDGTWQKDYSSDANFQRQYVDPMERLRQQMSQQEQFARGTAYWMGQRGQTPFSTALQQRLQMLTG